MCDRAHLNVLPLKQRSRTTNDPSSLAGVDRRSAGARRARDLTRQFEQRILDAGGEISLAERVVVDTAVTLVLQEEALRGALIRGETVESDEIIRLAGAVRRVMAETIKTSAARVAERAANPLQAYAARREIQKGETP